ncbi:hypothetical protein IWQ61_000174 [Dispira simplex]|nr:hypothetical protein IWQ61_000174 [Dispira simplex]
MVPESNTPAGLLARTLSESLYCPPPEPGLNPDDINPLCILLDRARIKEASSDFTTLCRSASQLSMSQLATKTSPTRQYPQSQPVTPLNRSPVLNIPGGQFPERTHSGHVDDSLMGYRRAKLRKSSSSTNMLKKLTSLSQNPLRTATSNPLLRIITTENTVIFRGKPEESRGRVLRGTVCLLLTHSLKARRLRLTFRGVEHVRCYLDHHQADTVNADDRHMDVSQDLVNHTWTFQDTEPGQAAVTLQPGSYTWPFEIALPGDLPETMCASYGEVSYMLRAELERPGFYFNVIEKKPIVIQRYMVPDESSLFSDATLPPWYSGYHSDSNLRYSVHVPNTVYAFGETIPVTIRLKNEVRRPDPQTSLEEGTSSSDSESTESADDGDQGLRLNLDRGPSTSTALQQPIATVETSSKVPLSECPSGSQACDYFDYIDGTSQANENMVYTFHNLGCYNIATSINEYTYFYAPDRQHYRRTSRVVQKVKQPISREVSRSGIFETTVYITIPEPSRAGDCRAIIHDCRTTFMKVKHKIKVGIQVHQGELHGKILVTLPITIVPAPIDHLLADPPQYSEAAPLDGDPISISTVAPTPASSVYSSQPVSRNGSPPLSGCGSGYNTLNHSTVSTTAAQGNDTTGKPRGLALSHAHYSYSLSDPHTKPIARSVSLQNLGVAHHMPSASANESPKPFTPPTPPPCYSEAVSPVPTRSRFYSTL